LNGSLEAKELTPLIFSSGLSPPTFLHFHSKLPLPNSNHTSTEKPSSSSAFPEQTLQGQTKTFIAHYADVFNVCPSLRRFSLRPLASCSATVLTSKDMTLATFG
jgi:hypothetical protein